MKQIYDLLCSDKEPFLYVEKSIICMKDGFLTTLSGKNGKQIISPATHIMLMLGAGTSITQEAAIFCAQHNLHISFVRGGSNIHSFFMYGRYQDPKKIVNQVNVQSEYKYQISKELLKLRFKLIDQNFDNDIEECKDIESLTLYEARWTKKRYKEYCLKNKVPYFKREYEGKDVYNERLNILNNVLYSLCSAIVLMCHLNPSIGFIHGYSRRGGLSFDLADLIKTRCVFNHTFSDKNKEKTTRQLMYSMMSTLKENNNKYLKLLIKICLVLGEDGFTIDKFKDVLYEDYSV